MGKMTRKELRKKYGLKAGRGCCGGDCCVHLCCHRCALCQERREVDFRTSALKRSMSTGSGHLATSAVMMPPQQISIHVPGNQEREEVAEEPTPIKEIEIDDLVSWSVAFKGDKRGRFSGNEMQVLNKGCVAWSPALFSNWITKCLDQEKWDSWILYNDSPPSKKGAALGHAKGIMLWNKDFIGWLVHSVPGWPKSLNDLSLPETKGISPGELGQSFAWIKIPRHHTKLFTGTIKNVTRQEWEKGNYGVNLDSEKTALEAIFEHISLLIGSSKNAYECNFYLQEEKELFEMNSLADSKDLHVISLSYVKDPSQAKVYHVAKGRNWKPRPGIPVDTVIVKQSQDYIETQELPDFYRHGLLHGFGTMMTKTFIPTTNSERRKIQKMIAEDTTDRNLSYYCDSEVTKVESILFYDRSSESYNVCPSENDQSKWAISGDKESRKWSFVGDLDRTLDQGDRSGGGFVIVDDSLRDQIKEMAHTFQPQHPYHFDF